MLASRQGEAGQSDHGVAAPVAEPVIVGKGRYTKVPGFQRACLDVECPEWIVPWGRPTGFSGVYCPGLITALVLYPPLFWYLSQVAYRDGLLTNILGVVAFLIAVVIHTVDVATSVFGVKLQSHRHTI